MKDIDNICATARILGKLNDNPVLTRANPLPDIANPGVTIPVIVAKRLKLCVYDSKYLPRLSRLLSLRRW